MVAINVTKDDIIHNDFYHTYMNVYTKKLLIELMILLFQNNTMNMMNVKYKVYMPMRYMHLFVRKAANIVRVFCDIKWIVQL